MRSDCNCTKNEIDDEASPMENAVTIQMSVGGCKQKDRRMERQTEGQTVQGGDHSVDYSAMVKYTSVYRELIHN